MKYAILVVEHRQLFVTCTSLRVFRDMLDARMLIEFDGEIASAIQLLSPYAQAGVAEAEFLLSEIGLPQETSDEFDARHLRLLESSAIKGYPPALYRLGACFDVGDLVPEDKKRAAGYFREAALGDHAHSQWIHGQDLLHGRNGVTKDPIKGQEFLLKSAAAKFAPALATVAKHYEVGAFGFPKSPAEAEKCRSIMQDVDAIEMS